MEPLIHIAQHRIIICSRCGYAIVPTQIPAYLTGPKHQITVYKRRVMMAQVNAISGLITNQHELKSELQIPEPQHPLIPELSIYANGLGCRYQRCRFICRDKAVIQRHYRENHGWVNPYRRGSSLRQRQDHIYPWREQVYCQRFFTQGAQQEYFEVRPNYPNLQDVPRATPVSTVPDQARRELERITQRQETIASQEAVAQAEQMSDTNP